jgi:hypothetical protein
MLRQWFGKAQCIASFNRVNNMDLLFVIEIPIKAPDTVKVAVNRFWLQTLIQKMTNIVLDLPWGSIFDRHIEPQHKVLKGAHVVFHCVS